MKRGYKDNSGVEGVRRAMGVTGEEDKEDKEEKDKFLQRRTRRRRNSCGRTDERTDGSIKARGPRRSQK